MIDINRKVDFLLYILPSGQEHTLLALFDVGVSSRKWRIYFPAHVDPTIIVKELRRFFRQSAIAYDLLSSFEFL